MIQDITIRRLEDVIAGYEQSAEDKVEEAAAVRAQEVQEVRTGVGAWIRIPIEGQPPRSRQLISTRWRVTCRTGASVSFGW